MVHRFRCCISLLSNDVSRRNQSNLQLMRRKDQHTLVVADKHISKVKLIHYPYGTLLDRHCSNVASKSLASG